MRKSVRITLPLLPSRKFPYFYFLLTLPLRCQTPPLTLTPMQNRVKTILPPFVSPSIKLVCKLLFMLLQLFCRHSAQLIISATQSTKPSNSVLSQGRLEQEHNLRSKTRLREDQDKRCNVKAKYNQYQCQGNFKPGSRQYQGWVK